MTTTAPSERVDGREHPEAPDLQGISHLGLTVADLDRAVDFWCSVMGFRVVTQDREYCMVWHHNGTLAIGLSAQGGSAVGPFDEHHAGLDHLALAVADVPSLQSWAARFAEHGVPHSEITETDAGHHLNVRAPDDIAVELFVIKSEFAADVLGVTLGTDNGSGTGAGAAGTHR